VDGCLPFASGSVFADWGKILSAGGSVRLGTRVALRAMSTGSVYQVPVNTGRGSRAVNKRSVFLAPVST